MSNTTSIASHVAAESRVAAMEALSAPLTSSKASARPAAAPQTVFVQGSSTSPLPLPADFRTATAGVGQPLKQPPKRKECAVCRSVRQDGSDCPGRGNRKLCKWYGTPGARKGSCFPSELAQTTWYTQIRDEIETNHNFANFCMKSRNKSYSWNEDSWLSQANQVFSCLQTTLQYDNYDQTFNSYYMTPQVPVQINAYQVRSHHSAFHPGTRPSKFNNWILNASSRQVRVQLSTLVLLSGLYIYIFWIKRWILPAVHGSALLQRERISRPVPALRFVAITEFPFFSKSRCAFHPRTHLSELNNSFKPWAYRTTRARLGAGFIHSIGFNHSKCNYDYARFKGPLLFLFSAANSIIPSRVVTHV
ncbi:hypothetical protein B0H13DRAFT_1852295 [Mycena leptocephala]|nr:hypothetical protein B0H13DRAFT_1852295 [Mycena leptocephala]